MIEQTFVMIKPDGVERGLSGEIISKFEKVGLKIVAMRMHWVDEEFARKHYTEDISIRRGEKVRNLLVDFIKSGPVIAIVLEGVEAISLVRKLVGSTQPKEALPGTIRGDYTHVSYKHADKHGIAVKNVIHASADKNDAEYEIKLWFLDTDIHSYEAIHEKHTHR